MISVKRQDETEYILTVTNKDSSFDTPNLKGADGKDGADSGGGGGIGVPVGGTTGQILTKRSNADYDTAWKDNAGGGGTSGGVLPYQGTGLVVLGDSISVFAGSTVTAISSDSNGIVTLTCALSPAAKVGEMISINFVEPAEFNGHFRVESVSGSIYTVKNDKVAKDTTGTVMSGFLNRFACNLAQHTMNWVMFEHMLAQNRPPLKAVIAQSSIGIQPFIDNFDKLVEPRNPEYVVSALGANDVMTTDAHLTAAIEKCKTLLNLIISSGIKCHTCVRLVTALCNIM